MADDVRTIVPVADHLFNRATLLEAERLMTRTPEQLTDLHVSHLAHYVSERELAAILQRRDVAVRQRRDAASQQWADDTRTATATREPAPDAPITAADVEGITTFEALCEKFPDQPVTLGLLVKLHTFVIEINERNKERNVKIAALEQRAAAAETRTQALEQKAALLDAKPHVKFCGVWQREHVYQPGDATTHQGGLWICKAATPGEPAKDFVGWVLAVKRGSAG